MAQKERTTAAIVRSAQSLSSKPQGKVGIPSSSDVKTPFGGSRAGHSGPREILLALLHVPFVYSGRNGRYASPPPLITQLSRTQHLNQITPRPTFPSTQAQMAPQISICLLYPDPLTPACERALTGKQPLPSKPPQRVVRARPVDIMTLPYSDDEAEETPWEQPKSLAAARVRQVEPSLAAAFLSLQCS